MGKRVREEGRMAVDGSNAAEASHHKRKKDKSKNKKKKNKVKRTTLPPPSSPPRHQFDDEEQQPLQNNASKPSTHEVGDGPDSVAATPAPIGKRCLQVDDEEDGRGEDRGADDGSVSKKSVQPGSVIPATTETDVDAAATPGTMTSAKRPGIKWGDADQLTLLKELVGYAERNGCPCMMSRPYMASFRSSLPEGLSICRFSTKKIVDKVKDLKRMHANLNGMGKGNLKGRKAFVSEMVDLSVRLWGEAGKGTARKRRKMAVEDDDDDDYG